MGRDPFDPWAGDIEPLAPHTQCSIPGRSADAMRGLLQGLSSSRPTWSMPSEETRMALE
jgi:hypothetical protein